MEQLENYTYGRYRLEKFLGHGAYGDVYSALDTKSGQHVAVKRYERIFDSILEAKRILREIKILGKFQHENIIGLIDVFATDNYAKINEILIIIEIMDLDLR